AFLDRAEAAAAARLVGDDEAGCGDGALEDPLRAYEELVAAILTAAGPLEDACVDQIGLGGELAQARVGAGAGLGRSGHQDHAAQDRHGEREQGRDRTPRAYVPHATAQPFAHSAESTEAGRGGARGKHGGEPTAG